MLTRKLKPCLNLGPPTLGFSALCKDRIEKGRRHEYGTVQRGGWNKVNNLDIKAWSPAVKMLRW
jgi:hypothetical protein